MWLKLKWLTILTSVTVVANIVTCAAYTVGTPYSEWENESHLDRYAVHAPQILLNEPGTYKIIGIGENDSLFEVTSNDNMVEDIADQTILLCKTNSQIVIDGKGEYNIIIENLNIDVHNNEDLCAIQISPESNVRLTFRGENILVGGRSAAALNAEGTLIFTERSTGILEVSNSLCGIRGGNVTINGGNIRADNNYVGICGNNIMINNGNIISYTNKLGIFALSNITITGGEIKSANDTASPNEDISGMSADSAIDITGGVINGIKYPNEKSEDDHVVSVEEVTLRHPGSYRLMGTDNLVKSRATESEVIIEVDNNSQIIVEEPGEYNITMDNVDIDVSDIDNVHPFIVKSGATVNLTLVGDNVLCGGKGVAGIYAKDSLLKITKKSKGGTINLSNGMPSYLDSCNDNFGIYARDLIIDEGKIITSCSRYGIYAEGDIVLNGGQIKSSDHGLIATYAGGDIRIGKCKYKILNSFSGISGENVKVSDSQIVSFDVDGFLVNGKNIKINGGKVIGFSQDNGINGGDIEISDSAVELYCQHDGVCGRDIMVKDGNMVILSQQGSEINGDSVTINGGEITTSNFIGKEFDELCGDIEGIYAGNIDINTKINGVHYSIIHSNNK